MRVKLLDDQVAFYGIQVGHKFRSIVLEVVLHKFFILLEYFIIPRNNICNNQYFVLNEVRMV
jgi:hypothetical protein